MHVGVPLSGYAVDCEIDVYSPEMMATVCAHCLHLLNDVLKLLRSLLRAQLRLHSHDHDSGEELERHVFGRRANGERIAPRQALRELFVGVRRRKGREEHDGDEFAMEEISVRTEDKRLQSPTRKYAKRTPLPLMQLTILSAVRLAEPIAYTQIFPVSHCL